MFKRCNQVASVLFPAVRGEAYLQVTGLSFWFMEELNHGCQTQEGDDGTDLFHIGRP